MELTLGTDKIALNAGDGSATFTGDIIVPRVFSGPPSALTAALQVYQPFNSNNVVCDILGNGSATFAGDVNCNARFINLDPAGGDRYVYEIYAGGTTAADRRLAIDNNGTIKLGGSNIDGNPKIKLNSNGSINCSQIYWGVTKTGSATVSFEQGITYTLGTTTTAGVPWIFKSNNTNGVVLFDNATAWSPSASESRLKDIKSDLDVEQCWDLVRNIQLKRYYYKDQEDKTGVPFVGPMADWLGKQDPELLIDTGLSDDEGPIHTYNQGLLDTKALQALSTALVRIEELEAKVTSLEGGNN